MYVVSNRTNSLINDCQDGVPKPTLCPPLAVNWLEPVPLTVSLNCYKFLDSLKHTETAVDK